MGRPNIPTKMKVLKGTFRADQANPNEPHPREVKIPSAPSWDIGKSGLKEWERMTKELIEISVLTNFDYSALEVYCYWYGVFVDSVEILKGEASKFTEKARDARKDIREASEAIHKYGMQFGFTPSSRQKISAPSKKTKSALDEI